MDTNNTPKATKKSSKLSPEDKLALVVGAVTALIPAVMGIINAGLASRAKDAELAVLKAKVAALEASPAVALAAAKAAFDEAERQEAEARFRWAHATSRIPKQDARA